MRNDEHFFFYGWVIIVWHYQAYLLRWMSSTGFFLSIPYQSWKLDNNFQTIRISFCIVSLYICCMFLNGTMFFFPAIWALSIHFYCLWVPWCTSKWSLTVLKYYWGYTEVAERAKMISKRWILTRWLIFAHFTLSPAVHTIRNGSRISKMERLLKCRKFSYNKIKK